MIVASDGGRFLDIYNVSTASEDVAMVGWLWGAEIVNIRGDRSNIGLTQGAINKEECGISNRVSEVVEGVGEERRRREGEGEHGEGEEDGKKIEKNGWAMACIKLWDMWGIPLSA